MIVRYNAVCNRGVIRTEKKSRIIVTGRGNWIYVVEILRFVENTFLSILRRFCSRLVGDFCHLNAGI